MIRGIVESSLYVADLRRSTEFYTSALGFERLGGDDRFCALSVAGRQVQPGPQRPVAAPEVDDRAHGSAFLRAISA